MADLNNIFSNVPQNWLVSKLKYFSSIFTGNSLNDAEKNKFSINDDNLEGRVYISSKDINVHNNSCNYDTDLIIPYDETKYKVAPLGSSLLCIEGGSAGKKLTFTKQEVCFVNKLACFTGEDNESSKFIYYYLQSDGFKVQFNSSLSGLIGGVSLTNLNDFQVPIPPKQTQIRIAEFLDKKTAEIDAIIEKKEALLLRLEEKKKAIINEAVTGKKVWNGNAWTEPAEVKDSGIEWIGEIPAHWEVVALSWLSEIVRGASPRPAGDSKYFNGDYLPWITVGEVTNAEGKFITCTSSYLTEEGAKNSRIIEVGTLLLSNSGATLGVPKISLIKGCINDGSVAFLNLSDRLYKDYLYYFLESHTTIFRGEAAGYGQPNLNTDIVRNTPIPIPDLSEQLNICKRLDSLIKEIDVLFNSIDLQIEKLEEYRQSLISEAVTGKLKI